MDRLWKTFSYLGLQLGFCFYTVVFRGPAPESMFSLLCTASSGCAYSPRRAGRFPLASDASPIPKGKPGYLRVDTVHQGQHDGKAGVYHINAVDTVTQWQAIGCVETISERHMIPVLEAILHQFPFRILDFHCDNGSEFINQNVAGMLEKLLIEFTKSRAYRTTDNALVEGKNGATVRKHIGYGIYCFRPRRGDPAVLHGALQPLPQLPSTLWLPNAQARHTRTHAPRVCGRRLPHTFRKTIVPAALAAMPQTGIDHRTAPPASISTQRYRSCPAHAKSQTRRTQARPDLVVKSGSFLLAPANTWLAGEGGSTASPLPSRPIHGSPSTFRKDILFRSCFLTLFRLAPLWNVHQSSGSSRTGIKLPVQAHLWIGKCCKFRTLGVNFYCDLE